MNTINQLIQFRNVDAVTTNLDAIPGKKTRLCFTDPWYEHISDDITYILPENQLRTGKCSVHVLIPYKRVAATFVELALGFLNVHIGTPAGTLMNFLKARGHIMSLPQIDEMIKITEKGLETGINSDGSDNFAFLENRKKKISVCCFSRKESGWSVNIYNFEDGHHWPDGSNLLIHRTFL